jgi:hypothetical protein
MELFVIEVIIKRGGGGEAWLLTLKTEIGKRMYMYVLLG